MLRFSCGTLDYRELVSNPYCGRNLSPVVICPPG